jgi:hypothetical protein
LFIAYYKKRAVGNCVGGVGTKHVNQTIKWKNTKNSKDRENEREERK